MQSLYQFDPENIQESAIEQSTDQISPSETNEHLPTRSIPLKKIIFLLCSSIIFLFLVSVIGAAYMPRVFAFIPASIRQPINGALLNLPVPHNAEQVLIGFIQNTKDVTSYDQKIFIEAKVDGVETEIPGISASFSFAGSIEGPIDVSDQNNPAFKQRAVFVLGDGASYENLADIEISFVENNIFVKLNEITDLFASYFPINPSVLRQWFVLDLDEVDTYMNEFSGSIDQFDTLNVDSQQLAFDTRELLTTIGLIEHISLANVEEVNGEKSYKLHASLTGEELAKILVTFMKKFEVLSEEYGISTTTYSDEDYAYLQQFYSDIVSVLDVDLFISQETYHLLRVSGATAFQYPNETGVAPLEPSLYDGQSLADVELSFGWDAENINGIEQINAPEGAASIDTLMTSLLYGLYNNGSSDNQISEDEYDKVYGVVEDVSSALATYEFENRSLPLNLSILVENGYVDQIALDDDGYPYVDYYTDGDIGLVIGVVGVNSLSPLFIVYDTEDEQIVEMSLYEYLSYIEDIIPVEAARDVVGQHSLSDVDYSLVDDSASLLYRLFLHRYIR